MVFKKGNIPHNKGKKGIFHHTEEWKQKMSEMGKKRDLTPLHNAPHISWNRNKTGVYSQEVIEQKREQMRGNTRWLGKHHSEETKAKMSKSNKHIGPPKGCKRSEETRRRISEGLIKANRERKDEIFPPERRARMSEISRKTMLKRTFPIRETSIERTLQEAINEYHIPYEKHLTTCDICKPDMVFPELKIAVFADGDYWHSKTFNDGEQWEKDRNQDRVLSENGWSVLRFWEHEINSNPRVCVVKIMEAIYERRENGAHNDMLDYLGGKKQ